MDDVIIELKYWIKQTNTRGVMYELRSGVTTFPDQGFTIAVLNDIDKWVVNQNDMPHNPVIPNEALWELVDDLKRIHDTP